MKPSRIFRLLSLLAGLAGMSLTWADEYPFEVRVEQTGSGHRIVAYNSGPSPVSVRVWLPMAVNARADKPLPLYAVVPPGSGSRFLANVEPVLRGASSTFKTQSAWALGDFRGTSDGSAYRLPYSDGTEFLIGQAPGGVITTHSDDESRFAVDINLPLGTPVIAAREGVVIKTRSEFTRGAFDPALKTAANEVQILHPDGTIGIYAHLAPGSVFVAPGQRVREGMKIGLSGNTGYSSGPHLHMAVTRLVKTDAGFASESVPFQFYLGNPPVSFSPEQGQLILAQYNAEGRVPRPYETRMAISLPLTGAQPEVLFVIPQSLAEGLREVAMWQWFVGMVALVVGMVAFSNYRHARRRRALDAFLRKEPSQHDW